MSEEELGNAEAAPELNTPEPDATPPGTTHQAPKKDDPSPDGFVETKRFTGAIQKIQALTEELRSKDQELGALNSQIEQLSNQQAVREAEVQAGYGERDQKLEAALKEVEAIKSEASALQAKLGKIEIAKELGHPELVSIIDTIPSFEDQELQRKAIQDIIDFTDERIKARESTLLSGITPPVAPPSVTDTAPSSDEGWKQAIDNEDDPAKRDALFDQWWEWQQKQK